MDFDDSRSNSNSVHSIHSVKETDSVVKTQDSEGRSQLNNEYSFIKKLGEGTYGKVKLVLQGPEQKKFAIKIIRKDILKRKREMIRDEKGRVKYKDAFEDVLREIAIMKKLDHDNLVKLHEVIDSPESLKMYLVMEFADKGQIIEWDEEKRAFYNLHQTAFLEEEELRKIFSETIQGLYYLHQNGIIHRDIKPQNILCSEDGTMKIADFGVSGIVGESDMIKKAAGTHHFMAPECVTVNPNPEGYSGKLADIWSLGITFYAFIFYRVPFDSDDALDLFQKIETEEINFSEHREISHELRDLLRKLLEKEAHKRITLDELKVHPWFQKSEAGMKLAAKCNETTPKITVTKEDMWNAVTPFERVLFMKIMVKKVVERTRKTITKRRESLEVDKEMVNKLKSEHKHTM